MGLEELGLGLVSGLRLVVDICHSGIGLLDCQPIGQLVADIPVH